MKKNVNYVKKTFALILSAMLLLSCMPFAFAANDYDESSATVFTFSDTGITVSEGADKSYKTSKTSLTINGSGTYVLEGSCADGSVKVKKGTKDVTLVLKNLNLASSDTAPIACNKSTAVTIIAADGTENTLTDSAKNNDDNYADNENAENAVIKCKDGSQVTLCGSGTLNVNANGKNAIKSGATTDEEGEAWLLIKDITLNINAPVNDAINAEQLLTVESGTLTITAADDAIHSDLVLVVGSNDGEGPEIRVNDCYEGLEGANLSILSGNIIIHAEDDCLNAANSDLSDYSFTLEISGGTLYMDTESGDGIDSNGTLEISGGTVVVWSANTADNQPLDADGTISVTGGTVFAAGGSSGMGMKLNAAIPYITFGSQNQGGFGGGFGHGQKPLQGERSNDESGNVSADGANAALGIGRPGVGATLLEKGSAVSIKDESGNVLYTDTASCGASYVFFASESLQNSVSYSLYSKETAVSSTTVGGSSTQTSCTHICHKTGVLSQLVWKILCFVFKALNINEKCVCGASHY